MKFHCIKSILQCLNISKSVRLRSTLMLNIRRYAYVTLQKTFLELKDVLLLQYDLELNHSVVYRLLALNTGSLHSLRRKTDINIKFIIQDPTA
jgi:hypothetical protein